MFVQLSSGSVIGVHAVEEIWDKGADKGAVMLLTRKLHDAVRRVVDDERTRAVNIRNDPSISDIDWDLD